MTTEEVQAIIIETATRYGVPPAIALGVAKAESAFRQDAISSSGAIGVMQLMPPTAAGLQVDPYDVYQNIDGGVRYLSQMWRKYGDWSLVLASYNAGPGAVDRYGGIPPYKQTQAYVPKVLAYAAQFGASPLPSGGSWSSGGDAGSSAGAGADGDGDDSAGSALGLSTPVLAGAAILAALALVAYSQA